MNTRITLSEAEAGLLLALVRRDIARIEQLVRDAAIADLLVDTAQTRLLHLSRIESRLRNGLPAGDSGAAESRS